MKLYWLLGAGVLAGIGAAGFWLAKRFREGSAEQNQGGGDKKDWEECESRLCRAELERYGDRFADLYAPLRLAAEKTGYRVDEEDLAFSWEARLADDERVCNLYQKWQTLEAYPDGKKIEEWYAFLCSLGVARSVERSVVLREETMKKYEFVDDWKSYIGQTLQVKNGYWYLGNKILEKGVLTIGAAEGGMSKGTQAQEV